MQRSANMNRNWILEEFGTWLRQQLLHIYPFEFITAGAPGPSLAGILWESRAESII